MREFNYIVESGDAIKRAYGGATASKLNYYAKAIIEDDKPDIIILCVGTNYFTKKMQSAEETTEKIMDIAIVLFFLLLNNLDTKLVTDNKKLWKTVKPLSSDKHFSNNKITLSKK